MISVKSANRRKGSTNGLHYGYSLLGTTAPLVLYGIKSPVAPKKSKEERAGAVIRAKARKTIPFSARKRSSSSSN